MASREEMIAQLKRQDMIRELEARDAAASAAPAGDEALIQEQSPGISSWQRFVAKNFATSPAAAMGYLRQQLPQGADVREIRGQIGVKLPGETAFRALDPDTGAFSSDFLADAGDVAYDVGAGVLQGAATGLGTAAGPAAPAAMAGLGAASGGGLEYLRQRLGTALGVPNNEDMSQVGMAAGIGAAAGPAEKVVAGGYNALRNKLAPKVAEMASGVPAKVWRDFSQNTGRVAELSADPAKSLALIDDVKNTVVGSYQRQIGKAGEALNEARAKAAASGATVDVGPIREGLMGKIRKAEALATERPSAANTGKVDDLRQVYNDLFTEQKIDPATRNVSAFQLPDKMSPEAAFALKQQIGELANHVPGAATKLKNPTDKEIMHFANTGVKDLSSSMEKVIPGLESANAEYSNLLSEFKQVGNAFADAPTAAATARNLDSQAKKVLKERISKTLKPDEVKSLQEKLQALQTQAYLGDPASLPLSGLGTTSTSRSVPLATVGGTIGSLIGYKGGGGYAGAAAGGLLGSQAGLAAGSPAAIKRGYQLIVGAERGAKNIPVGRKGAYGAGLGTWEALQQRQD